MKLFAFAVTTAALTLGSAALAADGAFTAADKNGDGALTLDEVAVAMPDASPDAFTAADTDKSGTLSEGEFVAAINDGVLPES